MVIALADLSKSRIATRCVCCASTSLHAAPAILMPFVAHRVFGWMPTTIDDTWGLKTIPSGQAYSICKSLQCEQCGHLFLDIRFDDDELAQLYEDYRGGSYTALREHYEPGYATRNNALNAGIGHIAAIENFLERWVKRPPRILDWGGDTGKNTPYLNNNRALDIFDISEKPVIKGARRITSTELRQSRYDLVVCSQVLEHIPYPAALLAKIHAVMHRDTVLYVELPLEHVIQQHAHGALKHKRHWHEHINFYTEKSLITLLKLCGFDILDLTTLAIGTPDAPDHVFQVACKIS
jgi:hypothetical protein